MEIWMDCAMMLRKKNGLMGKFMTLLVVDIEFLCQVASNGILKVRKFLEGRMDRKIYIF